MNSNKWNSDVNRLVTSISQTNKNVTLHNCFINFQFDVTFANRSQVDQHRNCTQEQKYQAEISSEMFQFQTEICIVQSLDFRIIYIALIYQKAKQTDVNTAS